MRQVVSSRSEYHIWDSKMGVVSILIKNLMKDHIMVPVINRKNLISCVRTFCRYDLFFSIFAMSICYEYVL